MSAWTMSPATQWSQRFTGRRRWQVEETHDGGRRVVLHPRPAGSELPLRITARGWLVLASAALVLLTMGVMLGSSTPAFEVGARTESASPAGSGQGFVPVSVPVAPESTVVVRPGDTLWRIATRTFPDADPREAVVAFRRANGDDLASLQVGERLVVPSRL